MCVCVAYILCLGNMGTNSMTEVCMCALTHAHINTIHTPHNVHIPTFMEETPPNSINVACVCLVRNASEK